MKKFKGLLAMMLCLCMIFSNGSLSPMAAAISDQTADAVSIALDDEATASDANGDIEDVDDDADDQDTKGDQYGLVNYLVVGQPRVNTPDVEQILVGIGDKSAPIDYAVLHYTNVKTGSTYDVNAEIIDDESVLFTLDFADSSMAGEYEVTSIDYSVENEAYTLNLADTDIDASFGVDTDVNTNPDGVVTDAEESDENSDDISFVVTDKEGNEITADSIEAAVKASGVDNVNFDLKNRAPGSNNIVVVLDPGHGGSDVGATRAWNGVNYYERDINLKIALACKAELEQYKGVDVYITRTSNSSFTITPENPKKMEIRERCQYAKDMNADLLVSLHINSSGSGTTSTNGAEVYYPNTSYNPEISKMGKALGEAILKKLQELGIANRGTHYRDSTDGETYPDGSVADYYGINRYCKRHGFPGIIVEHAYINNAHDVSSFLSSDATLKKIGIADATAIAGFLNASKQDPATDKASTVAVLNNDGKSFTMRTDGIPNVNGVKYFIVNENDPNTILNYGALPGGDGAWYSVFNVSDFGYAGTYFIDTYATRPNDSYYKVGNTVTVKVDGNKATCKAVVANSDKNKGTFDVVVTDVTSERAMTGVEVRAWTEDNRSNVASYSATKQADGSYVAHVDVKNHGGLRGTYTVEAYVVSDNGVKTKGASLKHEIPYGDVGLSAFDADGNTIILIADKIPYSDAVNVNFDVTYGGANKRTYGAQKDNTGRWMSFFPVSDYGKAGEYSVTAYAKRKSGDNVKIGSFTFNVEGAKASGISIKNVNGSSFDAVVEGVSSKSAVTSVRIPAWTKGDLSDLYWYDAKKQSDGTYVAHIDIKNHNYNLGVYGIQAYIKTANKVEVNAASTCYDFSLKLQNAYGFNSGDDENFILVAEGVPYGNEISKVTFDVWKNGNDHTSHEAWLNSDYRWLAGFKVSEYGEAGTYHSDIYVTLKNKAKVKVGSMEFSVGAPTVSTVTIKNENKNLGTFDAVITGINSPSGVSNVIVPAWTKNDLSDLHYYSATKQSDGSYLAHIDIKNHNYNTGVYAVQAYIVGNNGISSNPASVCHNFEMAPANVYACDLGDNSNYIFVAEGVPYADKVSNVRYDVWVDSPSNVKQFASMKDADGRWLGFFNVSAFNLAGKYTVTANAVYKDGKTSKIGEFSFNVSGPTADGLSVKNVNNALGTFDVVVTGVKATAGVKQVTVPVWSKGDLSDLHYYIATKQSDGSYVAHVDVKTQGYNYGVYAIQAYVAGNNGISALCASTCFNLEKPTVSITAGNIATGTTSYEIKASNIPYAGNIKEVTVAVWRTGADDLMFYPGKKNNDGSWSGYAPIANHSKNGVYYTDVYATYNNGTTEKLGGTSYEVGNSYYQIMGTSSITVDKMVKYYNKYAKYPEFYATTDAPTIEAFCQIYMEECVAEGLKPEVAFCQAMKETGYLKFGGDVKIEQFNFAGLGAVGGGAGGATFGSVREGVRAHVQHLKAYASKDALVNPCVDPRFDLVGRGIAPYVEWLGAHENPYGRGWAMAVGYGYSIRYDYMDVLFAQ